MDRKEKYRVDLEYRLEVNRKNRERHHRRIQDRDYAKVCATRARIFNARVSIQHHEERLEFFYSRIKSDLKLLELLKRKKEAGR